MIPYAGTGRGCGRATCLVPGAEVSDEVRGVGDEQLAAAGVTHAHAGYPGPHSPLDVEPDTEPLEAKIDRLHRFGEQVITRLRG